jgi:hypothetical protein
MRAQIKLCAGYCNPNWIAAVAQLVTTPASHLRRSGPVPARRASDGGSGRLLTRVQLQTSVDMAQGLRELIALSLLAGLGCGLALAHGDLLFVAVFGGAIAMMCSTNRRRPSGLSTRRIKAYRAWASGRARQESQRLPMPAVRSDGP